MRVPIVVPGLLAFIYITTCDSNQFTQRKLFLFSVWPVFGAVLIWCRLQSDPIINHYLTTLL